MIIDCEGKAKLLDQRRNGLDVKRKHVRCEQDRPRNVIHSYFISAEMYLPNSCI
jgi:hypothetical protein